MARTVIDIDDKALAEAKKVLGTKTKVETVNASLRDIASRGRRTRDLDKMLDLMADLADPDVMRGAHRGSD
jgi:Arc/MetJ family transcription regulator